MTKDATTRTYAYDESGRRISEVDPWDTTYYIWSGDRLVAEYRQYYDETVYLYDASGSPIGFQYKDQQGYYTNGAFLTFWYEKNLQGDIVGICDENGNKFVSYSYDAWGNLVNMTISGDNLWSLHYNMAEANPFRYRGYYYDRETGLYYLGSRYYDPATGRFLNADGYVNANGDLTGFNMYAYCSNNPVMYTDPTGEFGIFSFLVATVLVVASVFSLSSCVPKQVYDTGKPVLEMYDALQDSKKVDYITAVSIIEYAKDENYQINMDFLLQAGASEKNINTFIEHCRSAANFLNSIEFSFGFPTFTELKSKGRGNITVGELDAFYKEVGIYETVSKARATANIVFIRVFLENGVDFIGSLLTIGVQ